MIKMTTTWKSSCTLCRNDIFYYPVKILLETTKNYNLDLDKNRIVSITCDYCNKTLDYEFPVMFTTGVIKLNRINNINKILK